MGKNNGNPDLVCEKNNSQNTMPFSVQQDPHVFIYMMNPQD